MKPVDVIAEWFAMTPSGPGIPDEGDRIEARGVIAALAGAGFTIHAAGDPNCKHLGQLTGPLYALRCDTCGACPVPMFSVMTVANTDDPRLHSYDDGHLP